MLLERTTQVHHHISYNTYLLSLPGISIQLLTIGMWIIHVEINLSGIFQ